MVLYCQGRQTCLDFPCMPLANYYPAAGQKKKAADEGPSYSEQLSQGFAGLAVGPQSKIITYALVPEIARSIPIIGRLTDYIKWIRDPAGELKKELQLQSTTDLILSHAVLGAARTVLAVSNARAGGTGEISNELVRQAMAFEWADKTLKIRRNPVKFLIEEFWGNVVKGNFLDNLIYDKKYLFYHSAGVGKDGKNWERWGKWRNNGIIENFNKYAQKYTGKRIEGSELKFGAHAFTVVLQDKDYKKLVPILKTVKTAWQVAMPTLVVGAIFPGAWVPMAVWQLANIDWRGLISRKHVDSFSPAELDIEIKKYGSYSGKIRGHSGSPDWVKGGEKLKWQEMDQWGKKIVLFGKERNLDKIFQNLADFTTVGGLYRTLITGESLFARGWKTEEVWFKENIIKNSAGQRRVFYDSDNPGATSHYFTTQPGGLEKSGFNTVSQKRILADGREVTLEIGKNASGKWFYRPRAKVVAQGVGAGAKVSRGLFHVQQFVSKIGFPIGLAILLPNPVTLGFAIYSVFKNAALVSSPLKKIGWKIVETDLATLQKLSNLQNNLALLKRLNINPADLNRLTNNGKNVLVWFEVSGDRWYHRLARFLHQASNPFDREVGWLRGLARWRDQKWSNAAKSVQGSRFFKVLVKIFNKIPGLKRFVKFVGRILKKLPFIGSLFRAGTFVVGGIKWVVAPGEAIKELIRDFLWSLAKKGLKWAIKKAWTKWLARPLGRLLAKWARNLPVGSFRRSAARFLLRNVSGSLKPPPKTLSSFSRGVRGLFNFAKNLPRLIGDLIKGIIKLVRVIVSFIKTTVKVVQAVVKTVSAVLKLLAAIPVILVIVCIIAIVVIAFCVLYLILMVVGIFLISNRFYQPPVTDYLEIQKTVADPAKTYVAGEVINYQINFMVKKPLSSLFLHDYFLVRREDLATGQTSYFFDPASINCAYADGSPIPEGGSGEDNDPAGPPGVWWRWGGVPTVPALNTWVSVACSAKVAEDVPETPDDYEGYTGGTLINHAIILGLIPGDVPNNNTAASVFLYLNPAASSWPVEHACITQGPNSSFSHGGQQAIDLASNYHIGWNIDAQPVYSTVDGSVLRVCLDGQYSGNYSSGVCGGYDGGSYLGGFFGTYVILHDPVSNVYVLYAHLAQPEFGLGEGASVNKGQTVGYVDTTGNSTGPHLHYAFLRNSQVAMIAPYVPYDIPSCSGTWPDKTCAQAFTDLGQPGKDCF